MRRQEVLAKGQVHSHLCRLVHKGFEADPFVGPQRSRFCCSINEEPASVQQKTKRRLDRETLARLEKGDARIHCAGLASG